MRLNVLALAFLTTSSFAADHPDFTGTWKLDLKASDSVEGLMKLQGISWMLRQAAKALVVVHTIEQTEEALQVSASSAVKSKEVVMPIDGVYREMEDDLVGTVHTAHRWAEDSSALISQSQLVLKDGVSAQMLMTRRLQDPNTMVLSLALIAEDGRKEQADRVFRRVE